MRPASRVFLKHLGPAAVAFTALHTYLWRAHDWDLANWIINLGERNGQEVFRSRVVLMTERGPFFGEGWPTDVWNFAFRCGPRVVIDAAAWGAGAGAYLLAAGPLGRTRVFGHRGRTRCGRCDYDLAGLAEPRCPECGGRI